MCMCSLTAVRTTPKYTRTTHSSSIIINFAHDTLIGQVPLALMTNCVPKHITLPANSVVTWKVRREKKHNLSESLVISLRSFFIGTGEACPVSDEYLKFNGINIKVGGTTESFAVAEQNCRANHGYLGKISNEQEITAMRFLAGTIINEWINVALNRKVNITGFNGNNNYFWVGLTNPDGVTCVNSGCTGKLKWLDGSDFTWNSTIHSSVVANSNYGFRLIVSELEFLAMDNNLTRSYVCMSLCVSEFFIP